MTLHHQHTQPTDFDTTFDEFCQLIDDYATKQVLPNTVGAALDEVRRVINEIELCQHEGHTPDHHDIPWRVGYLVFCMHLVERAGLCDGSARLLVAQFIDHMGVSLAGAIDIALVRLRCLNRGDDMVYVDTSMLVPLMKRDLSHHL